MFGNPHDLTPNFDRLAQRGTHLYHMLTPQPVCGPARAVLQTANMPPDLQALTGNAPANIAGYYRMVKKLNEAFGRVMDALTSLELRENTIVLFTSDHGCHFRTRRGEYKRTCYESVARVPGMLCGGPFEGGDW